MQGNVQGTYAGTVDVKSYVMSITVYFYFVRKTFKETLRLSLCSDHYLCRHPVKYRDCDSLLLQKLGILVSRYAKRPYHNDYYNLSITGLTAMMYNTNDAELVWSQTVLKVFMPQVASHYLLNDSCDRFIPC